uniref:Uncharacterized protein n=1 Tax=Romanomermis culicivorax TaxID=13658 RepID=A0A915IWC5_ROMCU
MLDNLFQTTTQAAPDEVKQRKFAKGAGPSPVGGGRRRFKNISSGADRRSTGKKCPHWWLYVP